MKKTLTNFFLSSTYLIIFSQPIFAAGVELENIPQTPWRGGAAGLFPNLGVFVSILLHNVYVIAGVLLFLIIFAGGYMFLNAGGGDDPKKAQAGKEAATWAAIGFGVIFASYWILQIIKVITGIDIINPGL